MIRTKYNHEGYSLIEMLVVVALFAVLAAIVTQSLTRSLVSTRKSESVIQVRENLDYATAVMERSLRNATKIQSCSATRIDYLDQEGTARYFECLQVGTLMGRVESDLGRITAETVSVSSCNFSCNLGGDVPDQINIQLGGQKAGASSTELSPVTIETTVFLRVY